MWCISHFDLNCEINNSIKNDCDNDFYFCKWIKCSLTILNMREFHWNLNSLGYFKTPQTFNSINHVNWELTFDMMVNTISSMWEVTCLKLRYRNSLWMLKLLLKI